MRRKTIQPILMAGTIIMILSVACGGGAQAPTATPITPKASPTAAPSYTPYPTYTPKPTPTRMPTSTPLPSPTSLYQPTATDVITGTAPINCVPSTNSGYNTCVDDSGMLQVDIPQTWVEVNGSTWTYNGQDIGVAISAAPNLVDFQSNYRSEGVFFGASGAFAQVYGHIELLDFYTKPYRENCTYIGRYNYEDGVYRGKYDKYTNCGGQGGYDAYVLGGRDIAEPSTKLILVEIQSYPGDISIRDQIWSTFFVYF